MRGKMVEGMRTSLISNELMAISILWVRPVVCLRLSHAQVKPDRWPLSVRGDLVRAAGRHHARPSRIGRHAYAVYAVSPHQISLFLNLTRSPTHPLQIFFFPKNSLHLLTPPALIFTLLTCHASPNPSKTTVTEL